MSMDVKMAWRNIWRNPRRTLLTICAITFSGMLLVFMLSFQFGSYETMINASVTIQTGHLQVQARGYHDKKQMQLVIGDTGKIVEILQQIPQIKAYSFRALGFSLVSSMDRTYGALVTGIDPVNETGVSRLKQLMRRGSFLTPGDLDRALVGSLLAKNLQVDIGDELTVLGQGRDGSIAATVVQVKGIYSSGIDEFDRASIHIPLEYFKEVYDMRGAAHAAVIIVNALGEVPDAKTKISSALSDTGFHDSLTVLDWEELMPGLRQGIELDLVSGMIFYVLLIIVVAFSILNTFLMAILERTREFGVMIAIGTTPGRLTKLLLFESMAMTLVGIFAGILAGCLVTYYFQVNGIDLGGSSELLGQYGISGRIHPKLSIWSISIGPLAVLLITFFAALYPALRVRRLKPVEAMVAV